MARGCAGQSGVVVRRLVNTQQLIVGAALSVALVGCGASTQPPNQQSTPVAASTSTAPEPPETQTPSEVPAVPIEFRVDVKTPKGYAASVSFTPGGAPLVEDGDPGKVKVTADKESAAGTPSGTISNTTAGDRGIALDGASSLTLRQYWALPKSLVRATCSDCVVGRTYARLLYSGDPPTDWDTGGMVWEVPGDATGDIRWLAPFAFAAQVDRESDYKYTPDSQFPEADRAALEAIFTGPPTYVVLTIPINWLKDGNSSSTPTKVSPATCTEDALGSDLHAIAFDVKTGKVLSEARARALGLTCLD